MKKSFSTLLFTLVVLAVQAKEIKLCPTTPQRISETAL